MTEQYCITDYGAIPDSSSDATQAIQNCVDACFLQGGGTVLVPDGNYQVSSIRLRSRVTLYLSENARLIASRNPQDYDGICHDTVEPIDSSLCGDMPWSREQQDGNSDFYRPFGRWSRAVIKAYGADHIAVIGEGKAEIDGRNCFDPEGEEHYRGPHGIAFFSCTNITLKGYTFSNSGNWAHCLFHCKDITVDGVRVIAGHDGIHMKGCDRVTIRNSSFVVGDDCIGGFDNCDVTVTDCDMNTACSCFRFGGTNLLVHGCRMEGPSVYPFRHSLSQEEKEKGENPKEHGRHNMLSVFTYYADASHEIRFRPGNIVFEDCTVKNSDRLIHYNFSGNELWQKICPLGSLTFRNVRAEGIGMPLNLYGEAKSVTDVTLQSVRVCFLSDVTYAVNLHACRLILEDTVFSGKNMKEWYHLYGEECRILSDGKDVSADSSITVRPDTPFHTDAI